MKEQATGEFIDVQNSTDYWPLCILKIDVFSWYNFIVKKHKGEKLLFSPYLQST